MPATVPTNSTLLRPAVIEVRYKDSEQFKKAVNLYKKLLCVPVQEGDDKTRTFRIGYSELADQRDMLLRLTYPLGKLDTINSCTVLYWKVAGPDLDQLRGLHQALQEQQGLTPIEEPPVSSRADHPAAQSVMMDKATGTLLGLTINPPVPTAVLPNENGSEALTLVEWFKAYAMKLLGYLLLLPAGFGVFQFGKRRGMREAELMRASGSAASPQV